MSVDWLKAWESRRRGASGTIVDNLSFRVKRARREPSIPRLDGFAFRHAGTWYCAYDDNGPILLIEAVGVFRGLHSTWSRLSRWRAHCSLLAEGRRFEFSYRPLWAAIDEALDPAFDAWDWADNDFFFWLTQIHLHNDLPSIGSSPQPGETLSH